MNNNEKILFVTHKLNIGGAAKMMKYAATIAKKTFSQVSMVSINDSTRVKDVPGEISVISMGINPKPRVLWQICAVWKLRNFLKNDDSKYVCTFVTQVALITKVAAVGLNKVIISAERSDPYTLSKLWKLVAKWIFRNSDYSLFQLPDARDFYELKDLARSFVIPNPILHNRSSATPNFGNRKKTIVSAGRFVKEKRFEVLIEAFAIVHKKYPSYRLVIYGSGPFLNKYNLQVSRLGIKDSVDFQGYVDNFESVVRDEGIFVLSSLFEGIPNTLIEAMSVGTPCVATNCTPGGPKMLTENGKNGILIPVNDPIIMAQAIMYLLDNPHEYEKYSRNAVRVCEMLKEEKIQNMWLQAFEYIKTH